MDNSEEIRTPDEPAATPDAAAEDAVASQPQDTGAVPLAAAATAETDVDQQMRRMSRRSFLWGTAAAGAVVAGRQWLVSRRLDDGVPWPFRRALEIDEQVSRDYFTGARLAPTFARSQASEPRANGDYGLSNEVDPDAWRLNVVGLADTSRSTMMRMPTPAPANPRPQDVHAQEKKGGDKKGTSGAGSAGRHENAAAAGTENMPVVSLTMADIKRLPRVEMVTELKCIEGWSVIVQWAGARFADFVGKYPPARTDGNLPQYVGIETPDGEYYIGLDMDSAMHPQTLLCYEMNGAPLTPEHGAPLRLVIPVKYGIKNLKRIGTIRFTDERPKDYWATQGYDWYAGH